MSSLTFAQVLEQLKSDKYAGKIVSIQDFLHKEDELLQIGEVNRDLGAEKLSDEFKVEDQEALIARTSEEKYVWADEQSSDSRAGDKYLDAEMLADYLLMRINAFGSVSLVEANARLMAFDQLEDISAHLITMEEHQKKVKDQGPKSIPSTYIPYDIPGGPRAPVREIPIKTKITAVEAFQSAARKEKLVSVSEFNRNVGALLLSGGVSKDESDVIGHDAFKTEDEIFAGYTDNIYVLEEQINGNARKPEVFVTGLGLAYAMASQTLQSHKARAVVEAFDMAQDHKNRSGLIRAPK
jgi:hypothetical protein